MGKPKNSRKRKNSSDGSSTQLKTARNGGSPVNVSDTLHRVNSVLYGDDSDSDESVSLNDTVFEASISGDMPGTNDNNSDKTAPGSAKGGGETPPTNSDILQYLKQMDKKLNKLDSLEEKVSKFDSELKKLWVFVHDRFKENKDAMSKVTERIDGLEFSLGLAQEQITQMTNDKAKVNETLLYVQSQLMRNNLIFTGITEDVNEKPDVTESKFRTFMVEKLVTRDIVDGFQLERAHRMRDNSSFGRMGRPRSIVAKFLRFKDREVVRQARPKLKGTGYFVNEQFPKEIADRRKELLPKMRQAIRDGKRAWISYDTLYIDGRPIRPESH